MVKLENIGKSFGAKTVLRDFSLDIREGERFVLLGESGCGKTTLLRLIAGFEEPCAGRIFIEGEKMEGFPVEKRPVGFIFQRHALFPHMTVYDNIAVGPRIRGIAETDIAGQIDELLRVTRLQDLRGAYPAQLSGGESQRVAIARAVINRPKILLLDEPLSSLDVNLRESLRRELVEMQKTFGITFLFVTHDREEAMSLADRMGIIEDGRLLQVGSPAELYDRPDNAFIAGFLGDVNRIEGEVEEQTEETVSVMLPDLGRVVCHSKKTFLTNASVVCLIRPEKLFLSTQERFGETLNRLDGVIEDKTFFGGRTLYLVKLKNGAIIKVTVQHRRSAHSDTAFRKGNPVSVLFDSKDVMLFLGN